MYHISVSHDYARNTHLFKIALTDLTNTLAASHTRTTLTKHIHSQLSPNTHTHTHPHNSHLTHTYTHTHPHNSHLTHTLTHTHTHTHPQWAVFSCGHPLCVECTAALTKHRQRHCSEPSVTIKCPLCREPSISNEINYVRVGVASEESQDIPVQGCHSTKIAAVVRTLLYLQRTEPGAKSLVFSAVSFVLITALSD